jgi:hypothetical protein
VKIVKNPVKNPVKNLQTGRTTANVALLSWFQFVQRLPVQSILLQYSQRGLEDGRAHN